MTTVEVESLVFGDNLLKLSTSQDYLKVVS